VREAASPPARRPRALGIRTKLLLTLSVLLAIPWLGYEYVTELERFLRESQARTLAGTAQAVAAALTDRPRLFAPRAPARTPGGHLPDDLVDAAVARAEPAAEGPSPDLERILQDLARTSSRISVVDRDLEVLARAGTLRRPPAPDDAGGLVHAVERRLLRPIYALVLEAPTEDFAEETAGRAFPSGPEVLRALDGAPATGQRMTMDEKATVVVAAHPVFVGDRVRGAVVVEQTTNAVMAERNRAFERLFTIVVGIVLAGMLALAIFASRLSGRILRLRDEVEQAIDAKGRVRRIVAGSRSGDEIGDLSRSFSSVLQRLGESAQHREELASRLSHELRTPVAIVKSSLENLRAEPDGPDAALYVERAQGGLDRLSEILTRMSEATRLEQSLHDADRERFDLVALVGACVDGYRGAYPGATIVVAAPSPVEVDAAPDLVAQMLDKLVANAAGFARPGTPIEIGVDRVEAWARLTVGNRGPRLPEAMRERLFESMVSVRSPSRRDDAPHLGLGLYIVRLIAEFHGGRVRAEDRADGDGVVVTVLLPAAA